MTPFAPENFRSSVLEILTGVFRRQTGSSDSITNFCIYQFYDAANDRTVNALGFDSNNELLYCLVQGPNVQSAVGTYYPNFAQKGNTATLLKGAASDTLADWVSRIAEGNDIVYLLGDKATREALQEIFDANSGKELNVLKIQYE